MPKNIMTVKWFPQNDVLSMFFAKVWKTHNLGSTNCKCTNCIILIEKASTVGRLLRFVLGFDRQIWNLLPLIDMFSFRSQECESDLDAWRSPQHAGSRLERHTLGRDALLHRSDIQRGDFGSQGRGYTLGLSKFEHAVDSERTWRNRLQQKVRTLESLMSL